MRNIVWATLLWLIPAIAYAQATLPIRDNISPNDLVQVIPNGVPSSRSVYVRASQLAASQLTAAGVFFAPDYGACTWDATHDVGACVNAAIAAAESAGGGTVTIPVGTYGVSTTIATTADNIGIACNAPAGAKAASDPFGEPPPAESGGCELKWIGTGGGRIMSFSAVSDASFLLSPKVDNIKFNGNDGLAADGLYLASVFGGVFNNLQFSGGFNGGNVINLDVIHGEHAVPHGSQWNHFTDTQIFNWKYTSNGVKLGFYQSTTGIGANASLDTFDNLHIYTGNGATGKGIWCWGCDNNVFNNSYVTVDVGGIAIDLDIYTDNGNFFAANNNIFEHVAWGFPGGIVVARGKTTYPTCLAFNYNNLGNCAWGNEFRDMDGSNGTPPPVSEPGAYTKYSIDYGVSVNESGLLAGDGTQPAQTIMDQYGSLHTCGTSAIANGAHTGTYYCVDNQTSITMANAPVSGPLDRYTIGLSGATLGAENLLFAHPSGTGKYLFDGGVLQADYTMLIGNDTSTCATLGLQGSLCMANGASTGLELTDGVKNWLVRQNGSHELELIQIGVTPGIRIANTNYPQVWFTGPVTPANAIINNLPTCDATIKFSIMAVSDQNGAPTYRGALTPGGTDAALAFCNGSTWEAH